MNIPVLLLLLWFAAVSAAAEGDGDRSPASRWAHPFGPPSGSARSHAAAPATFGAVRWRYKARRTLLGPPVTWDGIAFFLDGTAGAAELVALDLLDGSVLSRIGVRKPGAARLAVDRWSVFLIEDRDLVQIRLQAGKLQRRWTRSVGRKAANALVFSGEIYVSSPQALQRLRVGDPHPVWEKKGRFTGQPALFGDHLYALQRDDTGTSLVVFERTDGSPAGNLSLPQKAATGSSRGRVICAKGLVSVHLPGTASTWALLQRRLDKGRPILEYKRTEEILDEPLSGDAVLLGRIPEPRGWAVLGFGKRPRFLLVDAKQRPDLMEGCASCVSFSGLICFGNWIGAINGNRILWHLAERPEIKDFARGVAYRTVPGGRGLALAVPAGGKELCGIGPREYKR